MRHLSLCLIVLASCRSPSPSDLFVTNPIDASDIYPEVVRLSLVQADGRIGTCTGTFITKSKILTSAHCFFDDEGHPMVEIRYTDNKGAAHIGKMTASASYKPLRYYDRNDLGLVSFSEDSAPAIAKSRTTDLEVSQKIKLVGYGVTDAVAKTGHGRKNMGESSVRAIDLNMSYFSGYASPDPHRTLRLTYFTCDLLCLSLL